LIHALVAVEVVGFVGRIATVDSLAGPAAVIFAGSQKISRLIGFMVHRSV
jgi:hypothetical protein